LKHVRRYWQFWLGLGISLVLVLLLVLNVDMAEVWEAVRQANGWYLAPAILVVLVSQVARAYRWRLLLYPRRGLRMGRLFNIMSIGYLLNNLLPGRAGDLARPILLGYAEGTNVAGGLSAILVERLLDTMTIVVLLFGLLPLAPLPTDLRYGGIGVALALLALTAVLVLLSFQRERGRWLLSGLARRSRWFNHPVVSNSYDAVVDSLAVLRAPWPGLGLLAWTAIIWALAILQDYLVIMAFEPRLSLVAAAVALCVTGLGMLVPAPSGIGTFHWAAILALSLFGVSYSRALTIAVVMHLYSFGLTSVIGLVCMWAESLSYAEITRRIRPGSNMTRTEG